MSWIRPVPIYALATCAALLLGATALHAARRAAAADRPRTFVDINAASAVELAAVPGMGPKLADAVIESRYRDGAFEYPSQLLRVKGMGPIKAPRIARYLSFPRPSEDPGGRPRHPIDLNVAQAAELAVLPGMGWGLAYRVVTERERNGSYRTLDDLHYVEGVTRERVTAWRAYLYVEGAP